MTNLFLIILGIQAITTIIIIIWSFSAKTENVYNAIPLLLSTIMISSIANMVFVMFCILVQSLLFAVIFISVSIALYYCYKQCNVIIPKNQNFVLYEKFDKMPVSVTQSDGTKNPVEFRDGQHKTWPLRFTIGLQEGHKEEKQLTFGFSSNNNIITIPELATQCKEGIVTPITGIDVNLGVNDDKTYQLDLFEYGGKKRQEGALLFAFSQTRDVLMDFISKYPLAEIKTPALIREIVETNQRIDTNTVETQIAKEKCLLNQINTHLKQFQVKNGDNYEDFETYTVTKIKVAGINLPKKVSDALEKLLITQTENDTKKAENDALRLRAQENGVSVDTQKAIETDSVKKLDITGNHSGGVIVNTSKD